jgi:hypothetical protein
MGDLDKVWREAHIFFGRFTMLCHRGGMNFSPNKLPLRVFVFSYLIHAQRALDKKNGIGVIMGLLEQSIIGQGMIWERGNDDHHNYY